MKKVRTGEEALRVFDYLGIKEVSKEWQKRKGTHVYELPFKTIYHNGHGEINRFTIYKNGYIRKMIVGENNASRSCWQLNKVRKIEKFVKDYEWNDTNTDLGEMTWTGKYNKIYNRERIMVDGHKQRLVYLCNYILKNYYNSNKYGLVDEYTTKRVAEVHGEWWRNERKHDEWPFEDVQRNDVKIEGKYSEICDYVKDDIQVIINGHRYNLS